MPPPFARNTSDDLSAFGGSGPKIASTTTQTPNTGNFNMKGISDAFTNVSSQFGTSFEKMVDSAKGAVTDMFNLDPATARLKGAGLDKGADPNAKLSDLAASAPNVGKSASDHRVRLSLPMNSRVLYNKANPNYLLRPLVEAGGVIFPYTPQLIFQHNADYSKVSPTHSNYPLNFYSASNVSDISMFGEFTSETGTDARYVLAVITFLRAVTKMFSHSDDLAGNPPPVLRLSGHGQYMLPSIPVVVNTVSITMPNNVDYVTIPTGVFGDFDASTTRVPKSLDINVGLTPVYSRAQLRSFGVDRLANGQLISRVTGGFI